MPSARFGLQSGDLFANGERRLGGAPGIIFVHKGNAEHSHDPRADKISHYTAETFGLFGDAGRTHGHFVRRRKDVRTTDSRGIPVSTHSGQALGHYETAVALALAAGFTGDPLAMIGHAIEANPGDFLLGQSQ